MRHNARQCAAYFGLALAAALFCPALVQARTMTLQLLQHDGKPLAGAAVTLRSLNSSSLPSPGNAVVDQVARQFSPEVTVVAVGSNVSFPNSDSVGHQVYSFSPGKKFQLPLYRGKAYPPVRFDTPGIVTLGCNIHDNMIGYILVTDAEHFGTTTADGHWRISSLTAGEYELTLWHPRLRDNAATLTRRIRIDADSDSALTLRLTKPLRAAPLEGKSSLWDY